jgi:hypothetical protein
MREALNGGAREDIVSAHVIRGEDFAESEAPAFLE